jgi:hypothetical protein
VKNAKGSGISNLLIKLTDQIGNSRQTRTNSFGYYQFDDVEVGRTYVISPQNKKYRFVQPSIIVSILTRDDLNFEVRLE